MACITERKMKDGTMSFQIRVFVQQESNGKQHVKSMTFRPEPGLSKTQAMKEARHEASMFERRVKSSLGAYDGRIRFAEYASRWMDSAQIAYSTRCRYESLLARINPFLGSMSLQKIQAFHIESFYKSLKEPILKKIATAHGLRDAMREKGISKSKLMTLSGISCSVISSSLAGKQISAESAAKLSAALGAPLEKIFRVSVTRRTLSGVTIKHHHKLISAILGKALRERIISFNVAKDHVVAPKAQKKEARYLTCDEAQQLISLLINEDVRLKTSIMLALYSGVRKGELCGLSWKDINENSGLVYIRRASQFQGGKGVVEVPTKNESSKRAIKLPPIVFHVLAEYRLWWDAKKQEAGPGWQDSEGRLFVQNNGRPINPETINYWLGKFIKKHGLQHFTPHSLRHTFVTLQISAGVDIRTLQARTGHAQASTLTNTYAHVIKAKTEAAAELLDNMLTPKGMLEEHSAFM